MDKNKSRFVNQDREASNEEAFLFELMDFTELIGPNADNTNDEIWNDYRLETPRGIGFVITARPIISGPHKGAWEISSWYTYNA